jgi:V/A-type H+/Na+-transporting ATPase subunit G/H
MEDTLKRLLDAESRASEITRKAEQEAERIVQAARNEALKQQERFNERLPQIRQSLLEKAATRAEQSVAEMERRYDERVGALRGAAEKHEEEALDAAFDALLASRHPMP